MKQYCSAVHEVRLTAVRTRLALALALALAARLAAAPTSAKPAAHAMHDVSLAQARHTPLIDRW